MRMRRVVICDLSGSYHIFPHHRINETIFGKVHEYEIRVFKFSVTFVRNISHSKGPHTP